MSEYEVDENGEVIDEPGPSDDDAAEAEEAEQDGAATDPDSDEQGPEEAALPDTPAPDESPDQGEPGLTEADVEKNSKAMNRAADTYIKKAIAVLGTDLAGMQTCPLCAESWPGLRFPAMPNEPHLSAVRVAIGLEPGDQLPRDNYSRSCTACDGWGFTDSGSKVPGQTKLTCYDCQGRGWVPVGDERGSGSVTAAPTNTGNGGSGPVVFPSNDPPEVERLRQLGYIVVEPQPVLDIPGV